MHQTLLLAILSLAVAFNQAGADQVGAGQVGAGQVGADQVGAGQADITQTDLNQDGTDHGDVDQTAAAQQASRAQPVSEHLPREIKFGRTSSVQFQVRIFGVFKKIGSFTEMQGALSVRKDTVKVGARIQTASTTMQSSSDAALLKSQAYFDAAHFPEIVFQSLSFPVATLRNGGQISGKLTLRGISRQQMFRLTTKPCSKEFAQEPWRCGFDVVGTLKRSEFGMKARRGIVSDEVELTLNINANPN